MKKEIMKNYERRYEAELTAAFSRYVRHA
jgi:hypothetical protein